MALRAWALGSISGRDLEATLRVFQAFDAAVGRGRAPLALKQEPVL